jgi:hypothetical protein
MGVPRRRLLQAAAAVLGATTASNAAAPGSWSFMAGSDFNPLTVKTNNWGINVFVDGVGSSVLAVRATVQAHCGEAPGAPLLTATATQQASSKMALYLPLFDTQPDKFTVDWLLIEFVSPAGVLAAFENSPNAVVRYPVPIADAPRASVLR